MLFILFLDILNDRISVRIISTEVKLNLFFPGVFDDFFTFDGKKLICYQTLNLLIVGAQ